MAVAAQVCITTRGCIRIHAQTCRKLTAKPEIDQMTVLGKRGGVHMLHLLVTLVKFLEAFSTKGHWTNALEQISAEADLRGSAG